MRKLIPLLFILIVLLVIWSVISQYIPRLSTNVLGLQLPTVIGPQETVKVVTEESVTINIVKQVSPSVVTISEQAPPDQSSQDFNFGPFSIFGNPGGSSSNNQAPSGPQSIGSGFIVTADGLIVTNKHVVADTSGKYQVITNDSKKYDVQKIYRDPLNDVAIIKINPSQNSSESLKPVVLGDSSHLQVGQFVVAIGTALGEFNNTVTTGVVSGLGRGITAGDEYAGFSEQLNNVIQTSAAINPGNSGGPLLNSSGQVIGVNTAVSQTGQNIGFALPINVIKDSISTFNQTGQFNRPYLGVAYTMVTHDIAILNNTPEGAYVQNVVSGSPADTAGIQSGDTITKMDGQSISGNDILSQIISKKKVGDSVSIEIWRNGQSQTVNAKLATAPNQ